MRRFVPCVLVVASVSIVRVSPAAAAATAASSAAKPPSTAASAVPKTAHPAPPSSAAPASTAGHDSGPFIVGSGKKPTASAERFREKSGTTAESMGNVSLKDVVRATEEARKKRKDGKSTTTVITGETLVKAKKSSGDTQKENPKKSASSSAAATPGGYDAYRDSKGRDESWWKDTMKASHEKIRDLETRVTDLDTNIAGLRNAFYSQDDPAYRDGVIKPKWDAAIRDQERAKNDLSRAKLEEEALLEDARQSGALPGWLR